MKIELRETPIKNVVRYNKHLKKCEGYTDNGEDGVYGMGGKLNIRPEYQREFIYKDKQRDAVIDSIQKDWPLGILHFVKNKDGNYEVLDGQQRLISIGQYVSGDFSIRGMFFHNLKEDQQGQILNYKLLVSFCEGTDSEKLDWFQIINTAGEKLSHQESRNAIYHGPWVSNARKYFSRTGYGAHEIAAKYLKGTAIRQEYLETAIKWINNNDINGYMAKHQYDKDARNLWKYFSEVIDWVEEIFPTYRKQMKGVPFGLLYNKYKNNGYNSKEVEAEVDELMVDKEVQNKSGIYSYIFNRKEKELNIRTFPDDEKETKYKEQKGICARCNKAFNIDEMEADHIEPWSKGGKTVLENCQMLCLQCNRTKSDK